MAENYELIRLASIFGETSIYWGILWRELDSLMGFFLSPAGRSGSYWIPFEDLHPSNQARVITYRKENVPPPAPKITPKNLYLSTRNLRRRSKSPPFDWLSIGLILIKYQWRRASVNYNCLAISFHRNRGIRIEKCDRKDQRGIRRSLASTPSWSQYKGRGKR